MHAEAASTTLLSFTADRRREARAMEESVELDVGDYNPILGYS